jgi:putative hemolysin
MLNPFVEIVLLLILFLANGVLAMAEMAVVSARKIRLQQKAEAGDENARTALQLARQPADFLSTVQIGITLVGVLAGAFGGATLAGRLSPWLARLPWLALQPRLPAQCRLYPTWHRQWCTCSAPPRMWSCI